MENFTFLYLRHGETEANTQNLCSGGLCPTPLTSKGVKQIEDAAVKLAALGVIPDKIFYSTTDRTIQSKNILCAHPVFAHIATEGMDELRERNLGEWEGKSFSLVANKIYSEFYTPDNGESLGEFQERAYKAIDLIRADGAKLPLVICHGFFWQALFDVYEAKSPWIQNGEIYQVQITEKEELLSFKLV